MCPDKFPETKTQKNNRWLGHIKRTKEEMYKQTQKWKKEHRERSRELERKCYRKNRKRVLEHQRNTVLRSTKIPFIYGLKKRSYTNYCELCNRKIGIEIKRLLYHHWNNDKPELGIWICLRCDKICESFENRKKQEQLINKYLNLKQIIEKEVMI